MEGARREMQLPTPGDGGLSSQRRHAEYGEQASEMDTGQQQLVNRDNAISPIYNELHLRRTAPYLGGIESELLSLNKIARIIYDDQRPVLERTDMRE